MARKTKPAQESYDYERTTTVTTTTSGDNDASKSRSGSKGSKVSKDVKGRKSGFPAAGRSKARAWQIRPYSKSHSLPNPGSAVNLNDERWYLGKRAELGEKYAAVPWTAIAGDAIPREDIKFHVTETAPGNPDHVHYTTGDSRRFPSIMVAGLIPAIGSTNIAPMQLNLPWLVAAEQRLAYMQSKVSGSVGFHAADLVAYWFCAADIFAEIAAAERALKVARTWSVFENVSVPRCLCNALGWDYTSIVGNIRVFEGMIKEAIDMANTLLLPNDLTFVERWYFLYSNVLKDSNLPMAKYYAYRKDGYYTFEEQLYDTGTAAQFHFSPSMNTAGPAAVNTWTPQTWFDTIRANIMKMMPGRSGTVADVVSRMIRAYDVSVFYEYKMSSEEKIVPKFDPQALTAFANMSITGIPAAHFSAPDHFDIVQHVDHMTCGYKDMLWTTGLVLPENVLVRAWEAKPDTGTLFEITRLINSYETVSVTSAQIAAAKEFAEKLHYKASGEQAVTTPLLADDDEITYFIWTNTELVSSVSVYSGDGMTEASIPPKFSVTKQLTIADTLDHVVSAFNWLRFEYAPVLFAFAAQADVTDATKNAGIVGDIDNYATIRSAVLDRMHRFALTNLWGIATEYLG